MHFYNGEGKPIGSLALRTNCTTNDPHHRLVFLLAVAPAILARAPPSAMLTNAAAPAILAPAPLSAMLTMLLPRFLFGRHFRQIFSSRRDVLIHLSETRVLFSARFHQRAISHCS